MINLYHFNFLFIDFLFSIILVTISVIESAAKLLANGGIWVYNQLSKNKVKKKNRKKKNQNKKIHKINLGTFRRSKKNCKNSNENC